MPLLQLHSNVKPLVAISVVVDSRITSCKCYFFQLPVKQGYSSMDLTQREKTVHKLLFEIVHEVCINHWTYFLERSLGKM